MRVVAIADTHNNVVPDMPEGDLLIHAGDLTGVGTIPEVVAQLNWLSSLKDRYSHIVFVAGNHDFLFERQPQTAKMLVEEHPHLIYLEDSFVKIKGLKVWGSPVTPRFHNWAFNRDDDIAKYWSIIPDDVDILVTHGPAKYALDDARGENVGCRYLSARVNAISPSLHVCGHIHYGYGVKAYPKAPKGPRHAINAALTDDYNRLVRRPIEIDLTPVMPAAGKE